MRGPQGQWSQQRSALLHDGRVIGHGEPGAGRRGHGAGDLLPGSVRRREGEEGPRYSGQREGCDHDPARISRFPGDPGGQAEEHRHPTWNQETGEGCRSLGQMVM